MDLILRNGALIDGFVVAIIAFRCSCSVGDGVSSAIGLGRSVNSSIVVIDILVIIAVGDIVVVFIAVGDKLLVEDVESVPSSQQLGLAISHTSSSGAVCVVILVGDIPGDIVVVVNAVGDKFLGGVIEPSPLSQQPGSATSDT